ncbi:type IV pilus modification protein PilV [Thiolapillus sp.]
MSISLRFQQGATLLEVMIAAIIIGIGLLGIASLQVKAMQGSTDAEFRAKATDLAWALADRIRANLPADNSYLAGNGYTTDPQNTISTCPTAAAPSVCSAVPGGATVAQGTCTAANIASEDIEQIFCGTDFGINDQLPGGTLTLTCADIDTTDADACTTGSEMTITITWQTREDDPFNTGSNTDRIVMPFIPGAAQ